VTSAERATTYETGLTISKQRSGRSLATSSNDPARQLAGRFCYGDVRLYEPHSVHSITSPRTCPSSA
jgi:hypothetical protein